MAPENRNPLSQARWEIFSDLFQAGRHKRGLQWEFVQ
jgi:hypothetical protein